MFNFNNKTVWVTGAGRGIGLEIAKSFANLGAKVIGLDKKFCEQDLPFAKEIIELTSEQEIKALTAKLLQQDKLDILVNAAGILRVGGLDSLTTEDWQLSLATNLSAVFHLSQQVAPIFKQQKHGVIITIASNAATTARMDMLAYCASKAGVLSLTNCIALELAQYNVRCNTVSPGSTDTPMLQELQGAQTNSLQKLIAGIPEKYKLGIPLKKIANTGDIANAVLFLASDMAQHITMQNIIIDGGATLNS